MKFKVAIMDYVFSNLEIEKRELKRINAELIESKVSDKKRII